MKICPNEFKWFHSTCQLEVNLCKTGPKLDHQTYYCIHNFGIICQIKVHFVFELGNIYLQCSFLQKPKGAESHNTSVIILKNEKSVDLQFSYVLIIIMYYTLNCTWWCYVSYPMKKKSNSNSFVYTVAGTQWLHELEQGLIKLRKIKFNFFVSYISNINSFLS